MQNKDKDGSKADKPTKTEKGAETSAETGAKELVKPFDLSKLGKDERRMAKKWGLDVPAMAAWFDSVEQRFQALTENLPKVVGKAMDNALRNVQQEALKKQTALAQSGGVQTGGGGGLDMLSMIAKELKGDSGGDAEMRAMQKEMMRASIDNMKSGAASQKAIADAVVRKIVGKAIGDIP